LENNSKEHSHIPKHEASNTIQVSFGQIEIKQNLFYINE